MSHENEEVAGVFGFTLKHAQQESMRKLLKDLTRQSNKR